MTGARKMRIGQARLRIVEIDSIALVYGRGGDATAGYGSRDRTNSGMGRLRHRRRLKELIGELLEEIFIGQTGKIAETRDLRELPEAAGDCGDAAGCRRTS